MDLVATPKLVFPKLVGMTHQTSFSQAEFAEKKKITRREKFLTRLAAVIPWTKLLAVIEAFYPKGERGRPPIGLERRLRVYFLQQWYGLPAGREPALAHSSIRFGARKVSYWWDCANFHKANDPASSGAAAWSHVGPSFTVVFRFARALDVDSLPQRPARKPPICNRRWGRIH